MAEPCPWHSRACPGSATGFLCQEWVGRAAVLLSWKKKILLGASGARWAPGCSLGMENTISAAIFISRCLPSGIWEPARCCRSRCHQSDLWYLILFLMKEHGVCSLNAGWQAGGAQPALSRNMGTARSCGDDGSQRPHQESGEGPDGGTAQGSPCPAPASRHMEAGSSAVPRSQAGPAAGLSQSLSWLQRRDCPVVPGTGSWLRGHGMCGTPVAAASSGHSLGHVPGVSGRSLHSTCRRKGQQHPQRGAVGARGDREPQEPPAPAWW